MPTNNMSPGESLVGFTTSVAGTAFWVCVRSASAGCRCSEEATGLGVSL